MIAEPTLEHYIYYLRRVEGDNRKAIQERRAAFEEELRLLLAHLEGLSGQPIPTWEWPQESEDRRVSQRIVRTDWLDNSDTGRSCFAEARTYGDVYWLQVGYYQQGETGLEIFASLHDTAWQPSAADHLLGSSTYLCGIATDEVEESAVRALKAYTGDAPGTIRPTRLANGRAGLYGSSQQPYSTVIFYPNEASEKWAGYTILNNIALRLELYKHKTDRQLAWCEHNLPILSEQEQVLRGLLEKVGQPSPADVETVRRVLQLYRVFNGNAGMLAERLVTIRTNLDNLDIVLEELGALAEDRLLATVRYHLRQRQKQLETDLTFADQLRQQAERAVGALGAELALHRLLDLRAEPQDATVIRWAGWPGTPPSLESEVPPITPYPPLPPQAVIPRILQFVGRFLKSIATQLKPSRPLPYPQIIPSLDISLTALEENLLQHVYQGFDEVLIEKEFGGGYSGTRVLLALPVAPTEAGSLRAARRVTKLGPALELRGEQDNYTQYVQGFLPFCVAPVEGDRYYEQNDWAGLNYLFVGGGGLGQAMDFEEYYRKAASSQAVEQILKTLDTLLDKDLGQSWYHQTTPLTRFFAAEYGQHLVEHLRLRLRPGFPADALRPIGHLPTASNGYERIEIDAIPTKHATIQPGRQLSMEGLIVKRIKHNRVKLQDPGGRGIIVGVEFAPESKAAQGLEVGSVVSLRGEVVYNRRDRMEQIVRDAFPDLSPVIGDEYIELPGVVETYLNPGTYPNPLRVYSQVLSRMLESRQSYVHGDLHLRNVLVDEWGRGWLIDFARVAKRHNLFDFIKLETYVRLMALGSDDVAFSLDEYAQFEEALAAATLEERGVTCPNNTDLQFAYEVILATRHIARKYMGPEPDFRGEYFPALFLYCLAVMKYYQEDRPQPTQLAFTTALVLGHCLPEIAQWAHPPVPSIRPKPRPPSVESHLATGRRWAVMVGVNAYQDRDISNLTCCVADVEAVHRLLTDAAHGDYRARLLLDTTPDTLPTRNNVLAELANVAQAADEKDLLLFYFSGHGTIEAGEAYLVLSDARLTNLADSAVPLHRVKSIMADSAAQAKVIILDACHSGARIGKAEVRMSPDFMKRVFAEAEGLAILASCQQGQVSYEWEQAGQSAFTHYLLEGLTGAADFDNKGFVTIQDINRHVADRVKVWAVERGRSQTPTLGGGWSGDIVVCDYPEAQTLL